MSKPISITLDTGGLRESLRQFADDLQGDYLRSGAAAAARVLQDEIQQQVPVQSGLLKQSIYRYWDRGSTTGSQVYHVGVNKKTARHWHHIEYGHWRYNKIVNGRPMKAKIKPNAKNKTPGVLDPAIYNLPGALAKPVWVPATPYLRPAYDAKIDEALQAGLKRIGARVRGED